VETEWRKPFIDETEAVFKATMSRLRKQPRILLAYGEEDSNNPYQWIAAYENSLGATLD
jgi:hypothetical protein